MIDEVFRNENSKKKTDKSMLQDIIKPDAML
jgi:hypothetical protein